MLKLVKSTTNFINLTLKEKEVHTFLTYIFVFRSLDHEKNYVTTLLKTADLSAYKDRYNKFQIIEKTNPDVTLGEIALGVEGIYYYSVYSINAALTALQVAAIQSMTQEQIDVYTNYCLERGECYVEGFVQTTPSYTPNVINEPVFQPS